MPINHQSLDTSHMLKGFIHKTKNSREFLFEGIQGVSFWNWYPDVI